jgi:DNA polymerase elongation subunit (family B)
VVNLEDIKKECLVVDIETMAFWPNTQKEIDIQTNFNDYVKYAKVRWIGAYSYKTGKTCLLNDVDHNLSEFTNLFDSHRIIVGFNVLDFDLPILQNNNLIISSENKTIIDCMVVLGKSAFFTKDGYPYKNKGELMGYDFQSNSLRHMAEIMDVETQKGEISYKIFQQYTWEIDEIEKICTYLNGDIHSTKQIFDKLWDFWNPFTNLLSTRAIQDLSWIKGSIASLVYKVVCNLLDEEPVYSDSAVEHQEQMGGNVILPRIEEANNVYIIDFASLYQHIMVQFNLFAEVDESVGGKYIFHGNDLFKTKGYYDISVPHPLSRIVKKWLKDRIDLKKNDPDNPFIYVLKITLNGLYGIIRNPLFVKVYKKNAGWDTSWLGQQFQKLMEEMMLEFGFKTLAGDTDAIHICAIQSENSNDVYVKECLQKIVDKIKANVPFPVDTFNIAIEKKCDYIMYPHSEQDIVDDDTKKLLKEGNVEGYEERTEGKKKIIFDTKLNKSVKIGRSWVKEQRGLKKNYLMLFTNKEGKKEVELKGLPVIKNTSTQMGKDIFENVLKDKIIEKGSAKFDRKEIEDIINEYLAKPDALEIISQEYRIKPANIYKKENQIQSQISRTYFGGGSGVIRLIKNNLIGKVGTGVTKYCSIEEAKEAKLRINNLDLTKVMNELGVFIKNDLLTNINLNAKVVIEEDFNEKS